MVELLERIRNPLAFIKERRATGKKENKHREMFNEFAAALDLFYQEKDLLEDAGTISWGTGFSSSYYFPDQDTWLKTGYGLELIMPLIAGKANFVDTQNGRIMTDSISVGSYHSSAVVKGKSNVGKGHPYFDFAQQDRLVDILGREVILSAKDLKEFDPALAGLSYVHITPREITIAPSEIILAQDIDTVLKIQVQQYNGSARVTLFTSPNKPNPDYEYDIFSLDRKNPRKKVGNKTIVMTGGKKTGDPLIITVSDIQPGGNQEIKIPWVDPKPILAKVEQRMVQLKTQLEQPS